MWPRTSSTTAVACFLLVLLVLTHLALCSHGKEKCTQSMLRPPSSFSLKPGHYFYEPLVQVAPGDFLGALDDEEFFIVEGWEVAGPLGV